MYLLNIWSFGWVMLPAGKHYIFKNFRAVFTYFRYIWSSFLFSHIFHYLQRVFVSIIRNRLCYYFIHDYLIIIYYILHIYIVECIIYNIYNILLLHKNRYLPGDCKVCFQRLQVPSNGKCLTLHSG